MALFTDSGIIAIGDLLPFENTITQVATSQIIDVDGKIRLALSSAGDRLLEWLLSSGVADPQCSTRRQLGVSTVVITPPVQRWLCYEALTRIYAEAYNNQLNTRFQGKFKEYQVEAQKAAELFRMSGAGIVLKPLPKPDLPLVSLQSGTAPAQTIWVQTTWTSANGSESAPSPVNSLLLGANSSIVVAMAEGALNVPAAATGWNVYASSVENDITRQNTSPLAIGSTWQLPDSGFVEGLEAGNGQSPDAYVNLPRRILRG